MTPQQINLVQTSFQKVAPIAGTAADLSYLHSAGLAVDVQYDGLDPVTQRMTLGAARRAGLSWGGAYNDCDYFDFRPGGDLASLIRDFDERVRIKRLQGLTRWP